MTRQVPYRVDFAQLKRVVPLTAILSRYGLDGEFRREGARLKGACPIHKGSNKRQFVIDPNANTWRCFGDCDRGGAALEFVAEMEHVGIEQAAALVAEWFAIPFERVPVSQRKQRRPPMSGERPAYKVFAVEDKEDGADDNFKPWWTRIGSAWKFKSKDGREGFSVKLQALPVGDRIVLMEYTDEDAVEDDKKTAAKKRK